MNAPTRDQVKVGQALPPLELEELSDIQALIRAELGEFEEGESGSDEDL